MWLELLVQLLDRAFGQDLNHSRTLHLNFHAIGNLNAQKAVAQFADLAQEATGCDDFIAFGECIDHGLVLFLLFHLGANHDEIQHHKHQKQGQHGPRAY